MSASATVIVEAISGHRAVEFFYDEKVRLIEPHAIFENAVGNTVVRAWQVQPEEGWRLFNLEKEHKAVATNIASLAPRPGYKMNDKASVMMIAQVERDAPAVSDSAAAV